jgi:hypothetical protein
MEVAQGVIWRKFRAPWFRLLAHRQQAHASARHSPFAIKLKMKTG